MDESTKSGVRTRKRNKSIKDKAKLVSLNNKKKTLDVAKNLYNFFDIVLFRPWKVFLRFQFM